MQEAQIIQEAAQIIQGSTLAIQDHIRNADIVDVEHIETVHYTEGSKEASTPKDEKPHEAYEEGD